jgi:uncharacterized protein (TIGR02284 family)
MSIDVKDTRSIINDLIQTCKDGQKGFQEAADHVRDANVKALFLQFSQQRSKFAGELQQEVMSLGGEPEKSGSTMGALHRGWIDFKTKVTGQSDAAAIREAESGEDAAVKAYEDALSKESLPANIREIVERQYEAVRRAHGQVRALEVRTSGGAA